MVIILGIRITYSEEFLLKFVDPSRVEGLKKIIRQAFLARSYLYLTLFRTVGWMGFLHEKFLTPYQESNALKIVSKINYCLFNIILQHFWLSSVILFG